LLEPIRMHISPQSMAGTLRRELGSPGAQFVYLTGRPASHFMKPCVGLTAFQTEASRLAPSQTGWRLLSMSLTTNAASSSVWMLSRWASGCSFLQAALASPYGSRASEGCEGLW